MTKWSLWGIKNRWLRTAVAWPAVVVAVAIVLPLTVASGLVEAVKSFYHEVAGYARDWPWANTYRLLLGRDPAP